MNKLFLAGVSFFLIGVAQAGMTDGVMMRDGLVYPKYLGSGKVLVDGRWLERGSGVSINATTSGLMRDGDFPVSTITGRVNRDGQFLNSDLAGATIEAEITFDAYGQFQGATLVDSVIDSASASQDTYKDANLTRASIAGTVSGVSAFNGANLTDSNITATIGDSMDGGVMAFMSANLTGAKINAQFNTRSSFYDVFMFAATDLTGADFTGSTGLRASYFANATSLDGAILTGTGVTRSQLSAQGISSAVLDTIVF